MSLFEPYKTVQEPQMEPRVALRQIIERSKKEKRRAYIFINNRLEGNAPGTTAAIVGEEEHERVGEQ